MKQSRVLAGILAVALLLVWGRIGLQIAGAVGGEEESGEVVPVRVQTSDMGTMFEFPADTRDPFVYAAIFPEPGKKKMKHQEVPWAPPSVRLSGVVVEPHGSTAMIESGDGRVHFLRQGDMLEGAKIVRITSGAVTYSFRKRNAEWVLEGK